MVDRILGLHGWAVLAVVFLAPALEASAFLGVVVPGEIAVLLGGVLAFEHRASLPAVLCAAVAGAIIGDSVGYLVGRRWGRRLLDGSVGRLIPRHHLDRAEGYLAERGGPAVFFGRFTAALRALIPGLAGMAGLHYRTFALYNAAGGLLWASGFVLLGYVAGTGWRQVEQVAKRASLLLLLALLATAALVLAVRWLIGHPDRLTAVVDRQLARPWVARLRDRYQRQLAFLAGRLQPGGTLGLSLTVTVAALVAAGWAFGAVLQDVLARDELELVDRPVARFFVGHREAWLTRTLQDLSSLGSVRILVPLIVLVGVGWWLRRRTWRPLGLLAAACVGADLAFNAVKELVHRPRPPAGILLKPVAGPSFPSGHATQAVAVYGMLAALTVATTTSWARKVAAWALVVAITGAVAVSQLYLGTQWLTDVLGGLALGAAWLFALLTSVRTIDHLRAHPPTGRRRRPPTATIRRRRPARPRPEGHQPPAVPMAELVVVDRALVQALNHAARLQPLRLLVLLVATVLAAGPPLLLAVLAVQALRRRDPAALAVMVLTAVGGAAALGLNQLAGHLYFRPRPYWALPTVHAIGGRAGDSSFFSDHTTSPPRPPPGACSSPAAGAWPPPAPPS